MKMRATCIATSILLCWVQLGGASGSETEDASIFSVLKRKDVIFASTDKGLYLAALNDKKWKKLNTPSSMLPYGSFAQESADSSLLVYYRGEEMPGFPLKDGPTMFVSKDNGNSWEALATRDNFANAFVHPDGTIYAVVMQEIVQSGTENPPTSYVWVNGGQYYGERIKKSVDLGKIWKDITHNLPGTYLYGLLQDPDHPDLVCVAGRVYFHPLRGDNYQADDQNYQWKSCPRDVWRRKMPTNDSFFGGFSPGSNNTEDRPRLSTLFKYPFLKWGNGIDVTSEI